MNEPAAPALAPTPPGSYECGVCWSVYDPAEGDLDAGVRAGTPFEELPAHWVCPHCEAPRSRFMVALA
ncbi:MAG: rubredoxin [Deltaproteobacteria bacterium]